MRVYFGADHRGFKLKQQLKQWFSEKGYSVEDIGAHHLDPADDYPVIAEKLGRAVAVSEDRLGILLCGSGVGASAAVNKIDGVRAAVGISASQVGAGRHDDDMNILVLAADNTSLAAAKKMVKVFLEAPFGAAARYRRRLKQIKRLEEEN